MLHLQPCFRRTSLEHFRSIRTEWRGWREETSNVEGWRVGRKSCIHMVYASTSDHAHTHKRRRKFSLAHPRPKTARLLRRFERSIVPSTFPPNLRFSSSVALSPTIVLSFVSTTRSRVYYDQFGLVVLPGFGISFGLF